MRYILTYGLLAGFVIILTMIAGITFARETFFASAVYGYLVMLIAMTFIFVGVKRHRDVELGGVVRFGRAFAVGLGIAAVASVIYVTVWEIYEASTGYAFIGEYTESVLKAKAREGATPEALATMRAEMESMAVGYTKPWIRVPMVFLEIFPVGLLVALVSAALLRNPKVLPAR